MRSMFAGWTALAAAAVMAATGGKASAEESSATTFVGKLEGGPASARVAVVTDEDGFIAYVCSADDGFNQKAARWFRGTIEDGKFAAERDGLKFSGKISPDGVQGLMSTGDELSFTATPCDDTTLAGLFRA